MLRYERHLKPYARRLRRDMTDAEQRLWSSVRRKQLEGVQFYRQKPIGRYIVDFYAPSARLVVELDGGQHFDAEGMARDAIRDAYLQRVGLCVLRFDDRQALRETDAMIEAIWREIVKRRQKQIPPAPLFQRGGAPNSSEQMPAPIIDVAVP